MKNSFILHVDSLCILDKMSDVQAGKFLKAIYQYQKIKELPKMELLLEMAIAPFINQFSRDEKHYEKIVERNQKNGANGGRKKVTKKPSRTQSNPVGLNAGAASVTGEIPAEISEPQNPKNPDGPYNDSDSVNDSDNKKKNDFKKYDFGNAQLNKMWVEWQQFRKEKKNTLTPTGAWKQIELLKKYPPDIAAAMIDKSITSGWTGLFELKEAPKATVIELPVTPGYKNKNSYV